MRSYKSFEVRYCIKCGENIGVEIIHNEDGTTETNCFKKEGCSHDCEIFIKGKTGLPVNI